MHSGAALEHWQGTLFSWPGVVVTWWRAAKRSVTCWTLQAFWNCFSFSRHQAIRVGAALIFWTSKDSVLFPVYYWLVQRIWVCFDSKVFTVLGFSLVFWRLMTVTFLLCVLNATSTVLVVLVCSDNDWGTTCATTVWQVLIALMDKRSRIFDQIIKPWTSSLVLIFSYNTSSLLFPIS